MRTITRRRFVSESLKGTGVIATAAGLTAATRAHAQSPNDKVVLALIGAGGRGQSLANGMSTLENVEFKYVCDVNEQRGTEILRQAETRQKHAPRRIRDMREALDDKDVDAVMIATPDHWHALATVWACQAGKDVYVEKPVTLFPKEGAWMLEVSRKHKRVVQVGTQQRSGPHYLKAKELIAAGHIGKVVSVRMSSYRNIVPGFGSPPDQPPPADLDWDLWLGPAPQRPYNPLRAIYHFRWFWDYSGGQMTNLGHHQLDILDWYLGGPALKGVCSVGGRLTLRDIGETSDIQDAIYDFGDFTAIWSHREVAQGPPGGAGLEFCGTKGNLVVSRSGFTITADRRIPPENAIPQFTGAHPVGGPQSVVAAGPAQSWTEPMQDRTGNSSDQFVRHMRNFLACVRSREQPVSDLDSSQRVSTLCHLANLSMRLGRQLKWDAKAATIVGDDEAAKRLERPYRAPWDSELRKLLS
jgi:predicted dehydrogenase